ncbi:MAG: beta-Ala-His dipeptidase [Promethearchaeota archaeon]
MVLENLKPKLVWDIFENLLSKNPRISKHEEKIREAIKKWVKERSKLLGISVSIKEDDIGNILIKKPATHGMESIPTIIFQAHMDMVCVTDRSDGFDFNNAPIPIRIQNNDEWIDADGTTLGADNGIGVALALAFLFEQIEENKKISHGPVEVLLTVDEERSMSGASELDIVKLELNGKLLVNLDNMDLGIITIGCSGGGEVTLSKKLDQIGEFGEKTYKFIDIWISGLSGGHSGLEIHLPRANALKLMARCLSAVNEKIALNLCRWDGGDKINAIPRSSSVKIAVSSEEIDEFVRLFNDEKKTILKYWQNSSENTEKLEPNLSIDWKSNRNSELFFSEKETRLIIATANIVYNGPIHYSTVIEGLVETSNNFSIIETNGNMISFHFYTRGNHQLKSFMRSLVHLGKIADWKIDKTPAILGWLPDFKSPFLKYIKNQYEKILSKPISISATHGGLEPMVFGKKIPGIKMVSIGPTIKRLHSPEEKCRIADVGIIFLIMKEIVKNIEDYNIVT